VEEEIFKVLREKFKPFQGFPEYKEIPMNGIPREEIIGMIKKLIDNENKKWKEGYLSGCVYHGEDSHVEFLNEIYSIASQVNPLHPDVWPSSIKFEAEIVRMCSKIFNGKESVCGSVTSGGTESIFLAMKTYRDYARKKFAINEPEIILPVSAHAAFHKSAEYLGIRIKYVKLDEQFCANVEEIKEKISDKTIAIVASAPCFPYGTIDPIKDISEVAEDKNIPFHVDACLGGFILPWAKRLGYPVPSFDFELPGVTSISADLHKYGYSPKGVSVILYRDPELWRHQFYVNTKWPGGIYFSTTFQGSKAGGLLIAAWAAMLHLGEEGYIQATRKILEVADYIKENTSKFSEIKILGRPLWVLAFGSDVLNIYNVAEKMSEKGWGLNLLLNPPAFHIALTLRHDMSVARRFVSDLKISIEESKKLGSEAKGFAPIYGMMASLPVETSDELLSYLVQWMYMEP